MVWPCWWRLPPTRQGQAECQQSGGRTVCLEYEACIFWTGPGCRFPWRNFCEKNMALQNGREAHGKRLQDSLLLNFVPVVFNCWSQKVIQGVWGPIHKHTLMPGFPRCNRVSSGPCAGPRTFAGRPIWKPARKSMASPETICAQSPLPSLQALVKHFYLLLQGFQVDASVKVWPVLHGPPRLPGFVTFASPRNPTRMATRPWTSRTCLSRHLPDWQNWITPLTCWPMYHPVGQQFLDGPYTLLCMTSCTTCSWVPGRMRWLPLCDSCWRKDALTTMGPPEILMRCLQRSLKKFMQASKCPSSLEAFPPISQSKLTHNFTKRS